MDISEDNKWAMKLAVKNHASCRTEHIDGKHHLERDACDAGMVKSSVYVRKKDQHVDFFTKSLDIQKFYEHAKTVLNVV